MATTADELREEVRRRYAESARAVTEGAAGCGCGNPVRISTTPLAPTGGCCCGEPSRPESQESS